MVQAPKETKMEDTSTLKEIGKYAALAGGGVVIANPIVGGTILMVGGAAYVAAGLIDHLNSTDNCRHGDQEVVA